MQAGRLRQRVKAYELSATRSPTGALRAESWSHKYTLWADFAPLSTRDVTEAQAAGVNITARCVIRYRDDIHHKMRIEHRGAMYEIVGEPLADKNSGTQHLTLSLRRVGSAD